MTHPQGDIKYVAIYLRKSRGDEEKDLIKHRSALVKMCLDNNWKYVEYAEIGSGDSISARPQMIRLLKDIEDGLYDAVLVADYDRLGRGDKSDQATIEKAFEKSGTLIITPTRVLNLSNESDMMLADFQGMMARHEYKMIRKRLMQGKRIGAQLGNWVHGGVTPLPYDLDSTAKALVVNKDKLPTYRYIIQMALDGYTPMEILIDLNKKGIKSPRGSHWTYPSVRQLLVNEVHLGKVISNKSKWSKDEKGKKFKEKRNPSSEWIIVENCHEAVKTQEEHDKIITLLAKRKIIPSAAKAGKHALSGLIRCGVCGRGMQIRKRLDRPNEMIRGCNNFDELGNKCPNFGGIVTPLIDSIHNYIDKYVESILEQLDQSDAPDVNSLEAIIKDKQNELEKIKSAISRIQDMFEEGDYTKAQYQERMEKRNNDLIRVEGEIAEIQSQIRNEERVTLEEKIEVLENFKDKIGQANTSQTLNQLYRSIIDHIVWTKRSEKDEPEVEVYFI